MGVTGPHCHCPGAAVLPPSSSSSSQSVSSSEGLGPRWGRAPKGCSFSGLQPRPAGDGQREEELAGSNLPPVLEVQEAPVGISSGSHRVG